MLLSSSLTRDNRYKRAVIRRLFVVKMACQREQLETDTGGVKQRKRNEAFAKKAGKSNPLKPAPDALERASNKPSVSKWAIGALVFVVLGPGTTYYTLLALFPSLLTRVMNSVLPVDLSGLPHAQPTRFPQVIHLQHVQQQQRQSRRKEEVKQKVYKERKTAIRALL